MQIADFIAQSKGKFITVSFIKKDGTARTLNGRIGVTKHLKGGTSTINHAKYLGCLICTLQVIAASTKTPSCQ